VKNGRIAAIGPTADLTRQYANDQETAGRQRPTGHARQHLRPHPFLRRLCPGHGHSRRPMKDFPDILERLWWKLDRALLDMDVKYSALVCLVDAIKHGTTT
jgi:hypothetical protein